MTSTLTRPLAHAPGHPRRPSPRSLVVALTGYLVLLTWVIVWKLELPQLGDGSLRTIKLVPFVAGAGLGRNAPLELLANIALFVPFGVLLALLERPRRRGFALLACMFGSVVLETAQYVFAVGRSDLTDVLMNTLGGAIGLGAVAVSRRLWLRRGDLLVLRATIAGFLGLLLAVGVAFTAPVMPGQGDGGTVFTELPDVHVAPGDAY